MKYIQLIVVSTLLFFISFSCAFAREVTLYWEPSPSPNVIGYKVYYQQHRPEFPPPGTTTPIDVENSLTTTISGLHEDVIYYFSVTAYDNNNNESTYSNIVSTTWMPPLHFPADKMAVSLPVAFSWGAGPADENLSYTLYYGTDKDQVISAGLMSTHTHRPTGMSSMATTRVDAGSHTRHQVNDLEPGMTYYWKVNATSPYYPAPLYPSPIYSFDTQPDLPTHMELESSLPRHIHTMFFQ